MADTTAYISFVDGLAYPESPRWRDGMLWFSDVHNFRLKACDLTGNVIVDKAVPERPAGLGFMPDGQLLLATALGRRLHLYSDGAAKPVADLSPMTRGLLNDMVVDRKGRAYVGDTGYNLGAGEAYRPGQIFLFEEGSEARPVAFDVNFPNGMAVSPCGQTLYVAETFAKVVSAFKIMEDGSLADRRIHANLDGTPDGLCLDSEGALWVATLQRGQFQRIAPSGAVTQSIDVSPAHAVSCTLGGDARKTLFLCYAIVENDGNGSIRRQGFIRMLDAPAAGAGLP
jgi:sugar lactone lactonase YvrE